MWICTNLSRDRGINPPAENVEHMSDCSPEVLYKMFFSDTFPTSKEIDGYLASKPKLSDHGRKTIQILLQRGTNVFLVTNALSCVAYQYSDKLGIPRHQVYASGCRLTKDYTTSGLCETTSGVSAFEKAVLLHSLKKLNFEHI